MVTCKLYGGLGNQLFQMAAVMGYAKKHNLKYYFPLRKYLKELPTRKIFELNTYKEKAFNYNEIPPFTSVCLDGYFQSEKYFDNAREEILEAVGFDNKPLNKISIHVRRGDYLQTDCHPAVTLDYLNASIGYFKLRGYKDEDFLIFTDDKEWCSANFPFKIANGNELQDLELMSQCEHNIIANSSYSWWGAWLNQNANKIVISPKIWFSGRKANLNTSDLYCKNWIKL